MKRILWLLIFILVNVKVVWAQDSQSVLYVPLIGITSVPNPLALQKGPGKITYNYAVKNFLVETPLTNVRVVDDVCNPVKFVTGDDNDNKMLDYGETWRYSCSTMLSETIQNTATVTGTANSMTATQKAISRVVVGSNNPPPLVSVINVTKVAYPLSLPQQGGEITFTYKVTNPGVVPLGDVVISDNKCKDMSGKLGDTNGNNFLDPNEVWIYSCTMNLKETTTNVVSVSGYANGLIAASNASITVKVDQSSPAFPMTGGNNNNLNMVIWETMIVVLIVLVIIYILKRKLKGK